MNRRTLLAGAGAIAAVGTTSSLSGERPSEQSDAGGADSAQGGGLPLVQFEPKSMLKVPETHVPRSRFPVIDFHTHITRSARSVSGVSLAPERRYLATPQELLAVMDQKNMRGMVNLTGGFGDGLRETVARYDRAFPGRFFTFTEPSYPLFQRPNYPQLQAQAIAEAHAQGARGLKILKTLGLYLRSDTTSGSLVHVDDPRFDPMWDACGQLGIPVAIHVGDPLAFFLPTDRFNERYEELSNHPDWSFHGRDFPTVPEILAARNRVIARHPSTQFVVLHVGNLAEDLAEVSKSLDRYPNMSVDIAARIGELGRQPRMARRFFDRYQDRILFGTDATPQGTGTPQQFFDAALYEIYFRFLETEDEYFDYAPAATPPQGRWQIYGLGLPEGVLRKVYSENAARQLKLDQSHV